VRLHFEDSYRCCCKVGNLAARRLPFVLDLISPLPVYVDIAHLSDITDSKTVLLVLLLIAVHADFDCVCKVKGI